MHPLCNLPIHCHQVEPQAHTTYTDIVGTVIGCHIILRQQKKVFQKKEVLSRSEQNLYVQAT